jgi:DNA-binding protein HU-beta
MEDKLTNRDLAEQMSEHFDITKKAAQSYVDYLSELIGQELRNGNSVYLKHVGKLSVVERKPRVGINPKTKDKVEVPARKAIVFKAAKPLKEEIL